MFFIAYLIKCSRTKEFFFNRFFQPKIESENNLSSLSMKRIKVGCLRLQKTSIILAATCEYTGVFEEKQINLECYYMQKF